MTRFCAVGLLALLFVTTPAFPDTLAVQVPPRMSISLDVEFFDKSYGLVVIAASDTKCPHLRYRLSGAGKSVVTPALRPGEAMIIKLGQGLAVGRHIVAAKAVGCKAGLLAFHAVVLHKASPDHGARALAALARKSQRQIYHARARAAPA